MSALLVLLKSFDSTVFGRYDRSKKSELSMSLVDDVKYIKHGKSSHTNTIALGASKVESCH